MIIGNGLLAASLVNYDRDDVVFLASGVSDSKCTDLVEFNREKSLVADIVHQYPEKRIVFFSTFSINDPVLKQNMYVESKLALEEFIMENCDQYLIARVSNLVGKGGNPKTIFNFFFSSIIGGKQFSLWPNSVRNLIMEKDFAKILNFILANEWEIRKNEVVNIVNARSYTAGEIVHAIEVFTGISATYEMVDIKSSPRYEDAHALYLFQKLGIETGNYLQSILDTYYMDYKSPTLANVNQVSK